MFFDDMVQKSIGGHCWAKYKVGILRKKHYTFCRLIGNFTAQGHQQGLTFFIPATIILHCSIAHGTERAKLKNIKE
jgi:hypothetical protein